MSGLNESKGRPPRKGGRNGGAPGRGKSGKPHHKGADNAAGRGEGRARGTDQKKGRSARSNLPILIYGKGENIKTNLVEFPEQLTIIVPPFTSIVGNTLRASKIRPADGLSSDAVTPNNRQTMFCFVTLFVLSVRPKFLRRRCPPSWRQTPRPGRR